MDEDRFDDFTRLLGATGSRRAGLRAALGGLLGLGAGTTALEADAKRGRHADADAGKKHRKRKKTCKPACTDGYECVKVGKRRECQCPTGVTCGDACCRIGQVCQDGQCVAEPEPSQCIAAGEPCKGVGLPCCGGRTCSSGQGGFGDIACYVHKTGACQSTADCVYGTACIDGRCGFDVPPPAALGAPCNPTVGQQCADPGAVCVPYDGPDAPGGGGAFCTLPLNKTCSGDPDCTCYKCWYANPGAGGTTRADRAGSLSTRLACCGPAGYTCTSDRNCCLGTICVNGICQSETTCDVCKNGSCPYTSIAAAYDAKPTGSTITIAPGVYEEPEITPERDVTFRRCGDAGTVVWQNEANAGYLIRVYDQDDVAANVSFGFIEFTQTDPDDNDYSMDYLMKFAGSDNRRMKVTAIGCTWRDYYDDNGYSAVEAISNTDLEFANCVFRDIDLGNGVGAAIHSEGLSGNLNTLLLNRCDFTDNTAGDDQGGALALEYTALTANRSTFIGNTADTAGGAIYLVDDSTAALHDCALSGNTAEGRVFNGGGAIWVGHTCTLAVSGTTTISGNTTIDSNSNANNFGSGIRVSVWNANSSAVGRVTGATSANVSGNLLAPDCQVFDEFSPYSKFAVTCDGWCVPSGGACSSTGITACCNAGETCTGSNVCG